MPWTIEDVDKHKKGLSDKEKEQWVTVANSVLDKCLKDGGTDAVCAVDAIKQANGATEKKSVDILDKEIRTISNEDSEIRLLPNSRNIESYGIVFNKDSQLIYENGKYFYERISPEAVNGVIENSDILCLLNHNLDRGVLARSDHGSGSLKIQTDSRGVKYSFEAPKTSLGDELIENIKRGDVKGSSFSFKTNTNGDKWAKRNDGTYTRTINQFSFIDDFSPCYHPAYLDTSIALRNLEEFINTEDNSKVEVKPIAEEPVIVPITPVKEVPKVKDEPQNNNNLKINKMPTIKELQDKRAQAIEENEKIFTLTNTEKRAQTDTETETVKANNQKMLEYDLQIETEKRKLGSDKFVGQWIGITKKEEFSLLKTIRAMVDNRELPAPAMDLTLEGRDQFHNAAISDISGRLVIPARDDVPWKYESRANIIVGSAGQGLEIVATDKKAILPPLAPMLVFSKAGANYLTGLVGNVSFPSYAGTSVAWVAEITGAADGGGGFASVEFAPKRLSGYIDVSKTFLAQDGVGAEKLLLSNIAEAVARKLEATVLGPATVGATFPSGIGYKLNSANGGGVVVLTGATITNKALIALETSVDTANALDGNLAYITNSKGRGLLKGIDKGTSNDTGDFLCNEANQVNGYPLLVTNGIVSTYGTGGDGNMVCFGNWRDLCVAQWGGFDITVDPYSRSIYNQVRITINAYFDAKGLRGLTGATTTLDEYAYSFAACSIK